MLLIKYYQKGDRIARRTARKEARYDRRNPNEGVPLPTQLPIFPLVRSINNDMTPMMTQSPNLVTRNTPAPSGPLWKRTTEPQAPVYDTFNQLFALARAAGEKTFNYRGKSFGTELAKSAPEPQPVQSRGVGPKVEIVNPWEITFPPKAQGPYPPIKSNQPLANTPPPNTKSRPGSSVNTGGPMSPSKPTSSNKPLTTTPPYTKSRLGSSVNTGGLGDASITAPPTLPGIGGIPSNQFIPYPTPNQPNPWQPQNKQKRLINYRIIEQHQ